MNGFALDTSAAVDYLRVDRVTPPPILDAKFLLMPLPVAGELFAGAYASNRAAVNLQKVDELIEACELIAPDAGTARRYGRLRGSGTLISERRRNDLWIAALCIQYRVPLLTNDSDYDSISDLTVIHW